MTESSTTKHSVLLANAVDSNKTSLPDSSPVERIDGLATLTLDWSKSSLLRQACPLCLPIVRSTQSWDGGSGDDPTKWKDLDHFPDFPTLRDSAVNGCRLCDFVRHAVLEDFRFRPIQVDPHASPEILSGWNKSVSFQSQRLYGFSHCPLRLQLNLGWSTRSILMTLYNPRARECQEIIDIDPSPLCPKSTELIQRWIKDCITTHDGCKPTHENYLPTRLIDLGGVENDQPVHLVCGKNCHVKVKYAALSYCWGKPKPSSTDFRTLTENLEARSSHIPVEELPMTLQDAIKVTRHLGIRYLWIDCLCIVQDDQDDWSRESGEMGDIFRNAHITIAATSATGMHDGFLQRPHCRTINMSDISPTAIDQVHLRYPGFLGDDVILRSEWNGRGWVFQERRLSQRVLHFSHQALYFECRFCFKNEAQDHLQHLAEDPSMKWRPGADSQRLRTLKSERAVSYFNWYNDVREYSGKHLTVSTDKLPALSGLAKKAQSVLEDEYLAGLWRKDIFHGILWKSEHTAKLRSPQINRAPSWSWASLDGQVEWLTMLIAASEDPRRPTGGSRELATIVKLKVVPMTSDSTGQVKQGCLKFKGSLVALSSVLDKGHSDWNHVLSRSEYSSDLGVQFSGASNLWLFPVLETWYHLVFGLILEPTDEAPHEYRRFGWFQVRIENMLPPLQKMLNGELAADFTISII